MPRPRLLAAACVLVAVCAGIAKAGPPAARAAGDPIRPVAPSPEVRAMLGDVSPSQISQYDHALVGFKNRNTLSEQHNPNRGIGAARDYIFQQFKKIAATSDGRMDVKLQSFVQPKVPGELPRAVRITVAAISSAMAAKAFFINSKRTASFMRLPPAGCAPCRTSRAAAAVTETSIPSGTTV